MLVMVVKVGLSNTLCAGSESYWTWTGQLNSERLKVLALRVYYVEVVVWEVAGLVMGVLKGVFVRMVGAV